MKSPRLLLLLASLFFSLSILAQKKGDVNSDQTVDISDVVAVINTMAGDNIYKSTADVNNDGDTDISDVVAIINIMAYGAPDDKNSIRLSDLNKIIFNGNDMSVVNGGTTTDYKITEGLGLNLTSPGTNAGGKFLDIYSQGKIVASLTFSDADQMEFGANDVLNFLLNNKIIHQTSVTKVDSILVYDRSQEPLVYLGVMCFNQALYEKAIGVLNKNTVESYKSFISSLTTKYGTTLYYATDNALDRILAFNFGTPLKSVNLITFTDGLDQGSHVLNDTYETDENYLSHLKSRIANTKVAGLPLTAYSLGLRGNDVTDYTQFQSNLRSLASSNDNAFEVTSMSAVESKLGSIADDIIYRTTTQKVSFTIPGTSKGTKVRIVLDGKTAENSTAYIEGTYQTSDKSLYDVTLKGITSNGASSLGVLPGSANGIFITFTVPDISSKFTISKGNIRQYNMSASSSTWQQNSEFNPDTDATTETTYYGTAIFLLLDCSSSMSSDFSNMKSYANNFIAKVAANAKTETTARPFGYNDPNKPDPAVEAGLCPDNHHPHIIDMGVAGKWSCCNVGASAPWEYGGYYAWGETEEKTTYNWGSYIHCNGSYDTCHNLGSDIAGTQYDVAHMKWGGKWRMPSLDQIKLLLNCTSEWTNVNGINGRKFTVPNGGSIFLPAAGDRWNDGTYNVGSDGNYWSSTQYPSYSYAAYDIDFYSGGTNWGNGSRRFGGQSVRPVTE